MYNQSPTQHPYVLTMKMEILLELTSNKLMVDPILMLEILSRRFFLRLNLPDHKSVLTNSKVHIKMEMELTYDLWDDMSLAMSVSSISEAMQRTFRGRLKRACDQISYLKTPTREVGLKTPYLICDYYGGSHEANECKQTNLAEQGNNKRKEKGDDGPEWIVRSKFEDELTNFILEKKSHAKGIGDMLDQHRKELHEKFSQILSTIRKMETPGSKAPTFAITTRSGVSTQDPPFPAPLRPTSDDLTEGEIKKERPEGEEPSIIQEPAPRPSIFYQPSKSSNLPVSSKLKKQKKDDEDERLLSIFKQIHINLPFPEAMIHMPNRAKVLKDLRSHMEKLEKAASSVKPSEECSAIIQRSLP
ncbi:hypothetical protein Tco_0770897 [Tanacetum coccineum]|uniref:Uncharacterized protein n=1 Tax=Tanacetum coccineum TaxID=301880 RepID=A0ABQ4ZG42_9ASTR